VAGDADEPEIFRPEAQGRLRQSHPDLSLGLSATRRRVALAAALFLTAAVLLFLYVFSR
jgi:hypothetical protein